MLFSNLRGNGLCSYTFLKGASGGNSNSPHFDQEAEPAMKWMAHWVLTVAVAAVLGGLCAGCTEAEGGTVSPVAAPAEPPPRRLEFPGFSILPPPGEGWERLTNRGAARLLLAFDGLFVKVVSPKELAHVYVAGHRTSGGSAGAKILAEAFARFIKSRDASSVMLPGATALPNCLRWEMMREATDYLHGIQFGHTSARVSQYQGYLCSHPDAPAYVVEIGYVDTVVKGEAMSTVGQGEAFLHSLGLTPSASRSSSFPPAARYAVRHWRRTHSGSQRRTRAPYPD
jgi:hypothetical protein